MLLAFGGQFAKTIIERHEVEAQGAQKVADDDKKGPMKIVLIGPFGRGNRRLSDGDFKRFRMSS